MRGQPHSGFVRQDTVAPTQPGGDRAANCALHIIAIGRLRLDATTQGYIVRKMAEGHSKMEAIRCLKRYIARELYYIIRHRHQEIHQAQITT
ncbi:hypothetical protein SAMN04487952_11514 [Halomonas caseinilytica]|nr:hypothetical protein SAMN04487952_11514 [Halomonas caseinilytica]